MGDLRKLLDVNVVSPDKITVELNALNPSSATMGDSRKIPDVNVVSPDQITVEAPVISQRSKSLEEPDEAETRQLRYYLKLFFYVAFKWKSNTFSLHIIYFVVMVIQITKVAVITDQMFRFGDDRADFSSIVNRGHTTLRHLLLKGWDARWETPSYPPLHGDFAVYDIKDLTSAINYAINRYNNAPVEAIGYYMLMPGDTMTVRMEYYDFGGLKYSKSSNLTISSTYFGTQQVHNKTNESTNGNRTVYSIDEAFKEKYISDPFKRLLRIVLPFTLHSVRIDPVTSHASCLHVHGEVSFRDLDNNGQVLLDLDTLTTKIPCREMGYTFEDAMLDKVSTVLGMAVMSLCILSLGLTVGSFAFAVFVFARTKVYMKHNYRKYYKPADDSERDLPQSEYMRFIRYGDVISMISDVLTLYGTSCLVFRKTDEGLTLQMLDSYAFWLSIGCILSWCCLLRYFQFHNKFHLLFATIYRAMWNVLAYMLCVCVLFAGYWVSGYVVLGPYHDKFKTPEMAGSTLFTTINGDEIFITLHTLDEKKVGGEWVWWFSRFYIYSYVAIFTVIVINILIAIFMSAYEVVQEYYKEDNADRDLGPVEKALRTLLASRANEKGPNALRASLYDLMVGKGSQNLSTEEGVLKRELSKLVRISDTQKDFVLFKRRTLKAFIEDESDAAIVFTIGCCRFSFPLFCAHDDSN